MSQNNSVVLAVLTQSTSQGEMRAANVELCVGREVHTLKIYLYLIYLR